MYTVSTLNIDPVTDGAEQARNYHHGNLRETLLLKGLELLESSETADISLRELAREVGVSANAAYRHFANKEALMLAMAAEGFTRFSHGQVAALQQGDTPKQKFMLAGRAYIDFACKNPALYRLMFGRFSASHRSDDINSASNIAFQGLINMIAMVLQADPKSAEVDSAAIHAWSVVHGLSTLILDGHFDRHADNIDAFIDHLFAQNMLFWGGKL
jgi:AcrR family transcriptional regulator